MGQLKQLLIRAQDGDRDARAQVRRVLGRHEDCICLPGSPDDACTVHGYEAWKARRG